MDAAWRNYDCLLLSDASATTSPEYTQRCVEFNMRGWGFLLSCKDLVDGANTLEAGPRVGGRQHFQRLMILRCCRNSDTYHRTTKEPVSSRIPRELPAVNLYTCKEDYNSFV